MNPIDAYLQSLRDLRAPNNPLNSININNNEFRKRAEEFEQESFLYESEQFSTSEHYEDEGDGGEPKKIIVEQEPINTPLPSPTPTLTQTPSPTPTLTQTPSPTPTLTTSFTEPTYNLYFLSNDNHTIATEVDEGETVYVVLETTNVTEPIPYTITGISLEDIADDTILLTGFFNPNYDRILFRTSEDFLTEGQETMVITLDGITPTVSAALVINDAFPTGVPTYNMYFTDGSNNPQLTANETDPLYGNDNYRILWLETTNIPAGTQIPYTITGISQEDIANEVPLTGTITLEYGGYGGFGIYFAEDFLTEGTETMVVTLNGITPTVSAALVINDTSTTP